MAIPAKVPTRIARNTPNFRLENMTAKNEKTKNKPAATKVVSYNFV